jgi:hypothetical protein
VDPEKIQVIREWLELKNVEEVRSFMGLSGYYKRFITWFSRISHFLAKEGEEIAMDRRM